MLKSLILSLILTTTPLTPIQINQSDIMNQINYNSISSVSCNKQGIQIDYNNNKGFWIEAQDVKSYTEYNEGIEVISLNNQIYWVEK